MFGPPTGSSSVNRPFGQAVIDGFDMDLESTTSNMIPFVAELRAKMDAATASTGRKFLLSAAPQCPFPDAAVGDILNQVAFDYVGIQFYNNYCGVQSFVSGSGGPGNFNFDTWYVLTWPASLLLV
jgi:chitinase